MANRRMFSKDIVRSDAFLDLPISAQALYFHLGMEADDRGYIANAKSIIRMLGSALGDLEQLANKRFVLIREEGLVLIKGWRINNYIQNDRFVETKFIDDLKKLFFDENNSYTEKETKTPCIQNVSKVYTQDRLGKVSIGKSNNNINTLEQGPSLTQEESEDDFNKKQSLKQIRMIERFEKFWSAYPKKRNKEHCFRWWKKHNPSEELLQKMLSKIEESRHTDQWIRESGQYIPYPHTWLNGGAWDDDLTIPRNEDADEITPEDLIEPDEDDEEGGEMKYGFKKES